MMFSQYKEEIIWLLQALANSNNQKEIISFWSALADLQTPNVEKKPSIRTRRVITLIGEPSVVYATTNLFEQLPTGDMVILLTSDKNTHQLHATYSTHAFVQWVDVLYIPPTCVKEEMAQLETVTLLIEDKLPLWSRVLFNDNHIANIVSTKMIKLPPARAYISVYDATQFTYDILLDDFVATPKITSILDRIPVDIPKDFVMKIHLEENQEKEKCVALIDNAAATMLNTYWLQNNPNVASWLPRLLVEIQALLKIRNAKSEKPDTVIAQMSEWGEELTHVN